jgi:hypothetical protein
MLGLLGPVLGCVTLQPLQVTLRGTLGKLPASDEQKIRTVFGLC